MTAPAALVDQLRRLAVRHEEILEAYLFGSVARGENQPHSDLDVAVYLDLDRIPEAGFGYAAELNELLAVELGSDKVDVVVLNQAPPLLYHRVLRDGIRCFSRDLRATTTREGAALSRYCDYLPQLEKIERAHRARIERAEFGQ